MWKSQRKPSGTITPAAGSNDRIGVRLVNGVLGEYVTIIARARVTVSVAAATGLRNRGDAFALAQEIVVDDNGTDRHVYSGPVLRFISEMNSPSALTASRIVPATDGTVPVGTYNLESAARVFFAWPMSLNPLETAFRESNSAQALSLLVRPVADPVAALVTKGGATVVVDQISFDVVHGFQVPQGGASSAPLFLPTVKQQTVNINGNVTGQAEYLRSPHLLRALVISQEVNGFGEVSDILDTTTGGLVLRGDFSTPIGPGAERFKNLCLESEFEFGGAVISSNRAHLGFNFQKYGKISDCLNLGQDTNMRLEFNAAPSAQAGQSMLRLTLCQLERVPGLTAAEIPFPY